MLNFKAGNKKFGFPGAKSYHDAMFSLALLLLVVVLDAASLGRGEWSNTGVWFYLLVALINGYLIRITHPYTVAFKVRITTFVIAFAGLVATVATGASFWGKW